MNEYYENLEEKLEQYIKILDKPLINRNDKHRKYSSDLFGFKVEHDKNNIVIRRNTIIWNDFNHYNHGKYISYNCLTGAVVEISNWRFGIRHGQTVLYKHGILIANKEYHYGHEKILNLEEITKNKVIVDEIDKLF